MPKIQQLNSLQKFYSMPPINAFTNVDRQAPRAAHNDAFTMAEGRRKVASEAAAAARAMMQLVSQSVSRLS